MGPAAAGLASMGKSVPHRRVQEVGVDELQRLAMISLHTSPLDQPGTGDAGGMNVYVVELAKRLAARASRSTSSPAPPLRPPPVVERATGSWSATSTPARSRG